MAETKTRYQLVNELKEVDTIEYADYHFYNGSTYKNLIIRLNGGSFFKFFCMPGQCGTAIVWGINGDLNKILSTCNEIGRIYGYTTIQVSYNREDYKKKFNGHGYKFAYEFKNKRTENNITVYFKEL